MFTDINEAVNYLNSRRNQYLGFNHFKLVVNKFKLNLNSLKIIHVAGTNGKGSFITYLNEALLASDYHTLTFKSPAMTNFFDRIQYDNQAMEADYFLEYLNKYQNLIEDESLNMFEVTLIFALMYALEKKVDYLLLEVGIGGRFDCSNIILSPSLSVITSIGMDHMDKLGSSLDEIAFEKAGIIKKDCPVLIGHLAETAKDVISFQADMKNAELFELEEVEIIDDHCYTYLGESYYLTNTAHYQKHNTALVIKALKILGINISVEVIRKIFKETQFIGRFQTISQEPLTIVDGAHNIDGIKELLKSSKKYKNKLAIVSILKDKEYLEMLNLLASEFDKVVFCEFDFYRSLKKDEVNDFEAYDNYYSAYLNYKDDYDCIIFCGSLYFVSLILKENRI